MRLISSSRRTVALGLFAISLAGLSGCGGGGGSKALTPAERSAQAFKTGNVSGTFDSTPTKAIGDTITQCFIQFANDNTSDKGVASFNYHLDGEMSYISYGAEVQNIAYTPGTTTDTSITGKVDFDLSNFTPNKYFKGTAHYTGNYSVNSKGELGMNGFLTGTDPNGAQTKVGIGFGYNAGQANVDLSGTYDGDIYFVGVKSSYTGAVITKVDATHVKMTIPYKDALSGTTKTISAVGQNTRSEFTGSFAGTDLNAGLAGDFGQMGLVTTNGGSTFTGYYSVVDDKGQSLNVGGYITAKRTSTGGGTNSVFKTGYYDGGIQRNGVLDGRIIRLNVVKNSATAGANGGMVIVTNTTAPNIGGRVASVAVVGSTATITVDRLSNTYSGIVVTGTISGSGLNNAAYTATLLNGTTETGTIDALGQGTTTTSNLTATWSGTATSTANGKVNTFAATFKSNGDGTVLITPTSTIGGGTYPVIAIPAFTAYQAGISFAGHVNGLVPVSSLGSTFNARVIGDFDGDANGTALGGSYVYSAGLDGGTPLITDVGSLSLTKH